MLAIKRFCNSNLNLKQFRLFRGNSHVTYCNKTGIALCNICFRRANFWQRSHFPILKININGGRKLAVPETRSEFFQHFGIYYYFLL